VRAFWCARAIVSRARRQRLWYTHTNTYTHTYTQLHIKSSKTNCTEYLAINLPKSHLCKLFLSTTAFQPSRICAARSFSDLWKKLPCFWQLSARALAMLLAVISWRRHSDRRLITRRNLCVVVVGVYMCSLAWSGFKRTLRQHKRRCRGDKRNHRLTNTTTNEH